MRKNLFTILFLIFIQTIIAFADIDISGYTEPYQTISASFPEPGVIAKIDVIEGVKVKENQILASLDTASLIADRDIAKERYALAQTRYEKISKLAEQHQSTPDELAQAKGNLQIEMLNVDKNNALIDRRTLRSPINGIVTEIMKHPSESVAVDTVVMKLVQIDKLLVNLFVDADIAKKLKVGDFLPVIFPQDNKTAKATIDFISPDADKASHTVRVKLLIDNSDYKFPSGILCKVPFPS